MMTAQQIRDAFTNYFVQHGHKALSSSSLLPDNDASVLLTTAGMQQFKPYFLGEKDPMKDFGAKRTTTIQKSFRTSDIDEVGDFSHLTFFEMLGFFCFGEYWKQETIDMTWEFFTQVLKLPGDRIWGTFFVGDEDVPRDEEAEKAWLKYLPAERVFAGPKKDNFWGPAGKVGTCGPAAEVYFQLVENPQGEPSSSTDFMEIGTLVFMEYNKDEKGQLTNLPQKNIDVGLGLERLAMVVQGKFDIFSTDAYTPILEKISALKGYSESGDQPTDGRRQRIIADHIRAACFLLADGVRFSNKDQGYILRRIVRRAADQFQTSNIEIVPLVDIVIEHFGGTYPELAKERGNIVELLHQELDQYKKILDINVADLVAKLRKIKPQPELDDKAGLSDIPLSSEEAFSLHTTHGISLDRLERLRFTFDKQDVEKKVQAHKELSRAGATEKFGGHGLNDPDLESKYTKDQIFMMTRLHTATHLLQASLRKILGPSIQQKGSDITPERFRFDFAFERKLTDEEKKQVEDLVNEKIHADLPVSWKMMPFQQAIDEGALAFFKEKYGNEVKVYTIGDFSKELCGGPHVEHTNQVGKFKIMGESSVGAGMRRIKAVAE